MNSGAAACPKCRSSLPGIHCNTTEAVPCPACGARILVEIFPAFFRTPSAGPAAETIIEEGAASCFYHEQKKAVTHCDGCGRFLCALCDMDFAGQHLCPACLQSGKKKGKLAVLDNSRGLWDSAALLCAVVAMIPVLSFVFGPLAIVLAIVSFYKPGSLVRRTHLRGIIALVLAVIATAFWAWLMFFHAD